jgi:hypothetical protein
LYYYQGVQQGMIAEEEYRRERKRWCMGQEKGEMT